jgi:hypothetical protein
MATNGFVNAIAEIGVQLVFHICEADILGPVGAYEKKMCTTYLDDMAV